MGNLCRVSSDIYGYFYYNICRVSLDMYGYFYYTCKYMGVICQWMGAVLLAIDVDIYFQN